MLPKLRASRRLPGGLAAQEFCDRGTLLSALQRGVFTVGGTSGDAARFNERVVLRAALRTARDVARGMQHIHASDIVHGCAVGKA